VRAARATGEGRQWWRGKAPSFGIQPLTWPSGLLASVQSLATANKLGNAVATELDEITTAPAALRTRR